MNPEYYIPSERILKPSQDYDFLRKEGLKYIEKLGNTFWTDYNAHDPGITILEALSYVITELGYRTDFYIKDLLTSKNGQILNGSFFTAREIMTNAALTELDYRKLLIDIEGITNAWYLATRKETDQYDYHLPHPTEQKVYINVLEDTLSFAPKDKNNKSLEQLSVRGLNKIFIELDEDVVLGDLNTTELEFAFLESSRWVQINITPEFSSWNDPKALLLSKMDKPSKVKNKK